METRTTRANAPRTRPSLRKSPGSFLLYLLSHGEEEEEKRPPSPPADHITSCYNNCPNDPRASTAQGQVTQFCALASQYASTNTASATGSAARTSSTGSATATATDDSESSSTATSTGSSSSSSSSSSANSAANLAISAGGLLAAVAGVMGALL